MKNLLTIFSLIFTLTLQNLVSADALDDFKNVIASKHFLIKYTVKTDTTYANDKRNSGYFIKSDGDAKIVDNNFSLDTMNFTEGINGEDFFIETVSAQKFGKMNVAVSYYKIDEKLFQFSRMIKDGKYKDFGKQMVAVYEINNKKIYGSIYLKNIMDLLSDEENYTRAGSGTNDEGLNYFDVKSKNKEDSNSLKAMRFYLKDDKIAKIAIAEYSRDSISDEMKGTHSIIEVEEFNSNPDDSYFKLPEKFKKTHFFGSWKYSGTVLNFMRSEIEDE